MTRMPSDEPILLNAEQLTCLASPLRSEMLGAAIIRGQFSVNELAETLGRKPKALYPHVRQLTEVGLLTQVGERLAGKRMEALYQPTSLRIQMPRDNFEPGYREAVRKKLQAVIRQTERENLRYLDSVVDQDLSISLRLYLRLAPNRILELRKKLLEIGDWAEQFADEEGALDVASTLIASPLTRPG